MKHIKYVSLFVSILFWSLSFKSYSQCDSWVQKADFGGIARARAVGFAIGDKGYIGTGMDGSTYYKDFWQYDPSTDTWSQKSDFPGAPRSYAVGFTIGNKGYLGTGTDASNTVYKDFYEYNPLNNQWTQKADFGGNARATAVGFTIGSKGYIGTGYDWVTNYADFWEYDPLSDSWTQKADFAGTARGWATSFVIENTGYVGVGWDVANVKDFWAYDPVLNQWIQKADFGGSFRNTPISFSINGMGYVGTGVHSSVFYNDFWQYKPDSNLWVQKGNFGGTGRRQGVSFVINGVAYAGTGRSGNTVQTNYKDIWAYVPEIMVDSQSYNDIACYGGNDGSINITASSGGLLTYSIDSGITFPFTTGELSPLNPGTYYLVIQSSNGCSRILDSVTINEAPLLALSVSSTDVNCPAGNDGDISATPNGGTPGYNFLWSSGDTVDFISGLSAGSYAVTVTDSNGCSISDSATIVELSQGPTTGTVIGPISTLEFGTENYTVPFNAGSIYTWIIVGGNQSSGNQSNSISVQWGSLGTGEISVVETDSLGCSGDTSYLTVAIGNVGIGDQSSAIIAFKTYPNPNQGTFIINGDISNNLGTTIYDNLGRQIDVIDLHSTGGWVDMTNYPPGIYTLGLRNEEGYQYVKVIKY